MLTGVIIFNNVGFSYFNGVVLTQNYFILESCAFGTKYLNTELHFRKSSIQFVADYSYQLETGEAGSGNITAEHKIYAAINVHYSFTHFTGSHNARATEVVT